jgi:hypothetical protein
MSQITQDEAPSTVIKKHYFNNTNYKRTFNILTFNFKRWH